jgi:hypothetical protein
VLTKWTRKSFGPKEHVRLHDRLCQANIFRKTLGFSYAFLMLTGLASFSVRFLRFEVTLAWAKEAEMLAVTFIVSCLSVCGFYVYVLVQLRREEKRGDAHKKHLPEHLYEMEPEPRQDDSENPTDPDFSSSVTANPSDSRAEGTLRQEAMVRVGLSWEAWRHTTTERPEVKSSSAWT